jgi:hypothetical protein
MMKMSILHLQSNHPDVHTNRNETCNRFLLLLYDLYARFLRVHQVLRDYIRYIRRKRPGEVLKLLFWNYRIIMVAQRIEARAF